MRVLWAPWRMEYLRKYGGGVKSCIFCDAVRGDDRSHYVVFRSRYSLAMLNIYPYNTAHVMVAPIRHVPRPDLLTEEEVMDVHRLVTLVMRAIEDEYSPHGFNIGMNIGRAAGAGIDAHMHIHIVPRWNGDTNFMPVIAGTKVVPENLGTTWERIRRAIQRWLSK